MRADDGHQRTGAAQMKGDVNVLKRIDRRDRRAEKAARGIKKKLLKTKRYTKAQKIVTVVLPNLPSNHFSKNCELVQHPNIFCSKRRLLRSKVDGKREFNLSEIVEDFEEPVALVVSSRVAGDAGRVSVVASKSDSALVKISDARVHLFDTPDQTFELRKIHLQDGQYIFYVCKSEADDTSECFQAPWALGLDRRLYETVQKRAAFMEGFGVVCEKETAASPDMDISTSVRGSTHDTCDGE